MADKKPIDLSAGIEGVSGPKGIDLSAGLEDSSTPAVGTPAFKQNLQRSKLRNVTGEMEAADTAAAAANPLLAAAKPGEDPRAVVGRQTLGTAHDIVSGTASLFKPAETPEEIGFTSSFSTFPQIGTALLALKRMVVDPSVDQYKHGATKLGALPIIGPMAAHMGEAAGSGNYVGAIVDAAQLATMTPDLAAATKGVGLSSVGKLRETVRGLSQRTVGASPESVTRPLVKDQIADISKTAEKQAAADASATVKHEEAVRKRDLSQQTADEAVEAANRKITEDAFAKAGEKKAAYERRAAEVAKANKEAETSAARKAELEKGLEEGSGSIGQKVKELGEKLREEGNEKYATVRAATAKDTGIAPIEIGQAVEHAQSNILQGSQESIKQFKELLGKSEDIASDLQKANVSATTISGEPNPRYQAALSELGADATRALTFEDLQGYSSELGAKLASGNLPGDVYQAIKFVKEKIDAAKGVIAERNGVGPALQDADAFWRSYQETFYDPTSAVAQVSKRVGVLDPRYYSEPFVKGKAAETGIAKLRGLPTRNTTDAAAIAETAEGLRKSHSELGSIKVGKTLPEVVKPKPVEVQYKQREEIPSPEFKPAETVKRGMKDLTVDDLREARGEKVYQASAFLGKMRPFEIVGLLSSPFTGHWGIGSVAALETVSRALSSDAVRKFISEPTAADLKYVSQLPEPQRAQLTQGIQEALKRASKSDRKVNVSPSLARILGITAIRPPANRREALERLQAR